MKDEVIPVLIRGDERQDEIVIGSHIKIVAEETAPVAVGRAMAGVLVAMLHNALAVEANEEPVAEVFATLACGCGLRIRALREQVQGVPQGHTAVRILMEAAQCHEREGIPPDMIAEWGIGVDEVMKASGMRVDMLAHPASPVKKPN